MFYYNGTPKQSKQILAMASTLVVMSQGREGRKTETSLADSTGTTTSPSVPVLRGTARGQAVAREAELVSEVLKSWPGAPESREGCEQRVTSFLLLVVTSASLVVTSALLVVTRTLLVTIS